MSDGQNDRISRNSSHFTCGCGCHDGDCYCIKCHCQFSKEDSQNVTISKTSNFENESKENRTQTKGEK